MLIFANQRVQNSGDPPSGSINIFQMTSTDLGKTWDSGHVIASVSDGLIANQSNHYRAALADQSVVYDPLTKMLYLVADVFQSGAGLTAFRKMSNPNNSGIDKSEMGYTPDKKYLKFFSSKDPSLHMVLVPKKISNNTDPNIHWPQAYKLIDNKFTNTNASNLLATNLYVDNSFINNQIRGSIWRSTTTDFSQFYKSNQTQIADNNFTFSSEFLKNVLDDQQRVLLFNVHNSFNASPTVLKKDSKNLKNKVMQTSILMKALSKSLNIPDSPKGLDDLTSHQTKPQSVAQSDLQKSVVAQKEWKNEIIGNIWAGRNEKLKGEESLNHGWITPFYIESYPYIYLFQSSNSGKTWSYTADITA